LRRSISVVGRRVEAERGVQATEARGGVEPEAERAQDGERADGSVPVPELPDGDHAEDDCEQCTHEAIATADVAVRGHTRQYSLRRLVGYSEPSTAARSAALFGAGVVVAESTMDVETFRYYSRWHAAANARRYRAPADPWRLVRVDPGDVESYTGALPLNYGLGRVRGGDWDAPEHRSAIRDTSLYRGLRERFAFGVAWEATAHYEDVAERFDEEDAVRGYESLDAFRAVRLAFLDDLYESIATDGYRANAAAADESGAAAAGLGHEPADDANAFETAYANKLEPLLVVARDGEIVWTEGYHRFAIADLLDLDAIPVQVCCRHERWQRVRDAVATRGIESATLPDGVDPNHPDLADVRERDH